MSLFSTIINSLSISGAVNLISQAAAAITGGADTPNSSEVLNPVAPSNIINVRWRSVSSTETLPGSDVATSSGVGHVAEFGEPTKTYGEWQEGGGAEVFSRFCHVGNEFLLHAEFWQLIGGNNWYNIWSSQDVYWKQYQTIEIDWADLSAKLKAIHPLSENLMVSGVYGTVVGMSVDLIQNGILDFSSLNTAYANEDSPTGTIGDDNIPLFNESIAPTVEMSTVKVGDINPTEVQVCSGGQAQKFAPYAYAATDVAGCEKFTLTVPMTLRFYFLPKDTNFQPNPDTVSGIANTKDYDSTTPSGGSAGGGAQLENAIPDMDDYKEEIETDKVSKYIAGINPIELFNGNSIIPYDSIFMSGDTYNLFVTAGGGVVSESGMYPNDRDTIFITQIKLSLDGNTMTVIQNSDFDDTPLLSLNEKVYGYIINSAGDYTCSFCGFVSSISRRLDGKAEHIVYECKDLTHYLNQVVTPSYFIYKPPSSESSDPGKTYDTIIKELLTKMGITNADVTLPNVAAPELNYNFTSARNVLEEMTSYLGKYVFYATKNGVLTINTSDSGSNVGSYRIPTRGESVGSHKVSTFYPTRDTVLSRSRIIITGDYAVKETESIGTYQYPVFNIEKPTPELIGEVTSEPAYVIDPRACTKTGVFCYKDEPTGQWITYFMFRPGKTIVTPLISNPEISAEFIKIYSGMSPYTTPTPYSSPRTTEGGMYQELPIEFISANFGNSFYYLYKWVRPGIHGNTGTDAIWYDKYLAISQKYCVRENEPLTAVFDTGEQGGVEVLKIPEFKKITSKNYNRDDTVLMRNYAAIVAEYHKPTYGGRAIIQGLENQLNLLDKVSFTNTDLPAIECTDLPIHSIVYDLVKRETTLELSDKLFFNLPFFDYKGELRKKAAQTALTIAAVDQFNKYNASRL